MNLQSIRVEIASDLPVKYEPLMLSFYVKGSIRKNGCVIIGDDYGTELWLDCRDGHIRSIDGAGQLPSRFVNSGIRQLAEFVAEYDRTMVRGPKCSEDDRHRHVAAFRERLQAIDAKALDYPDNWWSTIIEQLDDGIL